MEGRSKRPRKAAALPEGFVDGGSLSDSLSKEQVKSRRAGRKASTGAAAAAGRTGLDILAGLADSGDDEEDDAESEASQEGRAGSPDALDG